MSIAFDAEASGSNAGPLVLEYPLTVSGIDRILFTYIITIAYSPFLGNVSTVYYNNVLMTQIDNYTYTDFFAGSTPFINVYLYYLISPDTGTNNIHIDISGSQSASFIGSRSASYTGAAQSSVIDNHGVLFDNSGALSSFTQSLVTTATGCWVVGGIENHQLVESATSGCIYRSGVGNGDGIFDSNGAVSPGTTTFVVSAASPPNYWSGIMASFKPADAATLEWEPSLPIRNSRVVNVGY